MRGRSDTKRMPGVRGDAALPHAVPTLSARAPLASWAAAALALTAVVVFAVPAPGPLDDPRPARQRTGLLVDAAQARTVDLRLPGGPIGRKPVLVVFYRQAPRRQPLVQFAGEAPRGTASYVVAPRRPPARATIGDVPLLADPSGRIARALAMPIPKDGRSAVGYALVDAQARLRYATLDPDYVDHGFELHAVGAALP